ncbi:unnamed protein product [Brassica oleracea]
MGVAGSKLEKALGEQFPEGERYFGFENFGNTCYCNSKHSVLIKLLCYYILMQDAHEFLNYLLNELDDILEKEAKADNETSSSPGKISNGPKLLQANGVHKEPTVTWVHKIFQVTSSSFWLHYYTRVKLNRVPKPNQNQIINHIPSSHQTKSNHLKKKKSLVVYHKYGIFFSKHLSRIKC